MDMNVLRAWIVLTIVLYSELWEDNFNSTVLSAKRVHF